MVTDFVSNVITWQPDDLPDYSSPIRPGTKAKERDFFDSEHGISLRVILADPNHASPDFFSPRHRHTFDQLRYYHSRSVKYGNAVYGPGDVIYLPGGTHYGPMVDVSAGSMVTLQFAGSSGIPHFTVSQFADAKTRLMERGHFEKGIYVPDEGRRRDGWEAMLEEHTGQPAVYPDPAISNYIVVHTNNLKWRPIEGCPGVEAKYVGHFTESGPNVMLLKMAAGSVTPPGAMPCQQYRCLFEGAVRFEDEPGREFRPETSRYIPPACDGATEALEDSVILLVKLATEGSTYLPDSTV